MVSITCVSDVKACVKQCRCSETRSPKNISSSFFLVNTTHTLITIRDIITAGNSAFNRHDQSVVSNSGQNMTMADNPINKKCRGACDTLPNLMRSQPAPSIKHRYHRTMIMAAMALLASGDDNTKSSSLLLLLLWSPRRRRTTSRRIIIIMSRLMSFLGPFALTYLVSVSQISLHPSSLLSKRNTERNGMTVLSTADC